MRAQHHSSLRISRGHRHAAAGALLVVVTVATPRADASDAPSPRWGHAMAYDSARDRIVLFGGADSLEDRMADTWEWSGDGWMRLPATGPPPRAYAAMAFDPVREVVVLHGGRAPGRAPNRISLADTWEWNGVSWRHAASEGPSPRDHHATAYDPSLGRVVLHGGYGEGSVHGDTWAWDGKLWERVAEHGPPVRAAFDMALDPSREGIVLFGGLWLGGIYADAWEWKGGSWSELSEPYGNPTRDHHEIFYDRRRGEILLFGGKDFRFAARNTLLRLREGKLESIAEGGPDPRYNAAIAYDTKRSRAVLFGGRVRSGDDSIPFGDTWAWDGETWHELRAAR